MSRELSDTELLRAQDLLVQRATEGLTEEEQAELEQLGAADVVELDLAAAAAAVAVLPRTRMPPGVASRLLGTPKNAGTIDNTSTAPAVPAVAAMLPEPQSPRAVAARAPARRWRPQLIGGLVAAAGIALAVGAWGYALTRPPAAGVESSRDVGAEALRTAPDRVEMRWSSTSASLRGTVAWSTRRQLGTIDIKGLPELLATERFQLWIYDENRDDRYPVDGALFAAPGGEASGITVEPRRRVEHATKFVLTIEPADGVVVSQFQRTVAVASIAAPDQNRP